MVGFILSRRRRRALVAQASQSRRDEVAVAVAIGLVVFYNLVGMLDIISTSMAIGLGRGEEANPFMRAVMEQYGRGWIVAKLTLQSLVSAMVVWFPHRLVLALFAPAVAINTLVVLNNFAIAAGM